MTLISAVVETATDSTAVAAVTSPLWLPAIQAASTFAGLLLPILGAIWLAVQIIGKVYPAIRRK